MSVLSFCFESTQVRTLGDSFNPLFVALDICKALGFKNPWDAVKQHVDPEDLSKEEITDSKNRKQLVNCVNESGMYALIFGSKLPSAKRFKKWVTSEVLPAIRKTGQFSTAKNSSSIDTLTPAQQLLVQQAVGRRAQRTASHYQTIYRAIKLRFQIARYDQLPQSQLNECLAFIEGVDLNVPEAKETVYNPRQKTYTVTADFLERQRILVYNLKYLFNKPLMQAMRVMQALDIPDANKLCDAVHDMNLVQVERNLEQLGFAVKDLDCYKHWLANN